MGDRYVRAEFDAHLKGLKTTKEHWKQFYSQWTTYLSQIRGETGEFSGDLNPEMIESLPAEQKMRLKLLQDKAMKMNRHGYRR